ncbi:class I SAM-dependent methyltransferase [Thiocapsa imhoffii]|nr:class I SAM-dependent methyltransferase [Thiocapsa imhoffii]
MVDLVMSRQSGSYAFVEFDDTERRRLVMQGSATWSFEREFLEWTGLKAGDRVADVACGPGVISRLMAEYVGDEGFVTGIDISDELLKIAETIKRENSAFEQGSVYDLSDHRQQYDFVYVRLLFQHLERPLDAMSQIFSILKPGGKICVLDSDESVFGIFPPHEDLSFLIRETQALQAQRGGDRFVGGKLGYLMRASGFEQVAPRIFVMTPENMGRDTFLDVVLKFRPQLFPAEFRKEATERMQAIYDHALKHMTYGHNGSFVVKAVRPSPGPATREKA